MTIPLHVKPGECFNSVINGQSVLNKSLQNASPGDAIFFQLPEHPLKIANCVEITIPEGVKAGEEFHYQGVLGGNIYP